MTIPAKPTVDMYLDLSASAWDGDDAWLFGYYAAKCVRDITALLAPQGRPLPRCLEMPHMVAEVVA